MKIGRIEEETAAVRTYTFYRGIPAQPGQFIMVTDLKGGEKPFSLADCTEDYFSITVKKTGEFTGRLFAQKAGDLISFRGPYGTAFSLSTGKVLVLGGGYGVPPLYFLARKLLADGAAVTVVNGAKTKADLIFTGQFNKIGLRQFITTDDGSAGAAGSLVDLVQSILRDETFDFIYASGPEKMLKALAPLLEDIPYEFLLERYMKCAIGICGQCVMDPGGLRLCVEGPVISGRQLERLTEFGRYRRDVSGRRIPLT